MFGIGPLELAIIAIVAIVFIGPQKLPEVMRQFGRFFVQMRRYTSDIKAGIDDVIKEAERDLAREELEKLKAKLKEATDEINVQALPKPSPDEEYVNKEAHGDEVVTTTTDDPQAGPTSSVPTSETTQNNG